MSDLGGEPSMRTPDHIPGWFRDSGVSGDCSDVREAVRFLGGPDFPIGFLRSKESVRPVKSGGVQISFLESKIDGGLLVPAGYWIVRGHDEYPQLWAHDNFCKRFSRLADKPWTSAIGRELREKEIVDKAKADLDSLKPPGAVTEVPSGGGKLSAFARVLSGKPSSKGTEEISRETLPGAGRTVEQGEGYGIVDLGNEAERDLERSAPRREETSEKLAKAVDQEGARIFGDEWVGTQPAEGTRRRSILEALEDRYPEFTAARRLQIADTIESRLLKETIDREAMEMGAEALVDGIEEVRPDEPEWKGKPPAEGSRRKVILGALTDRFPGYTEERRLELADTIEVALLAASGHHGCAICDPDGDSPISSVTQDERTLFRLREERDELARECQAADDRGTAVLIRAERAEKEQAKLAEVIGQIDLIAEEALKPEPAQESGTYLRKIREEIDAGLTEARQEGATDVGRLNAIAEERWTRIGELEEQIESLKRAGIEVERVHDMLDDWGIARSGPEPGDLDPHPDDGAASYTLFQRAGQLIQRLRRTEADLNTEQHRVAAAAGPVPAGTRELHVVIAENHNPGDPSPFFVELEDQDGAGVGGFERRQGDPGLTHIVIPYARDDEWVQRVAMTAIVAGQEADKPFPADSLDGVLQEFGVTPTIPRSWPARGDHGARWLAEAEAEEKSQPVMDTEGELPDYERKLLDDREEARAAEGRFAEERDCAYALLRWLLPVTVARRVD